MNGIKLYIIDNGDPSVGINPQIWTIECPFEYDVEDIENIEQFRIDQIRLYQDYAEGRVTADYDNENYLDNY